MERNGPFSFSDRAVPLKRGASLLCFRLGPQEGGCWGPVSPLVHVDWGILGQMATHATGHLGFGVWGFYSKAAFVAGNSPLQHRVALQPEKTFKRGPGGLLGACFALSLMPIGELWAN
jgi:hypothetical protein